ncbi:MAG: citramalate synthase [Spirochaetota bacterium]
MDRIEILDSTLRDGAQGEGISFSVADKLEVVRTLDGLCVDIIEAGNPASNPKDLDFFAEIKGLKLVNSRLAAFGSTRRKGERASEDSGLKSLLSADTGTVVIFGKSWDFHAVKILGATLDENLLMIEESIAFMKASGRRVVYDAEHFFDGYKANPEYALRTVAAAAKGGAECLVLCDTNGGSLPDLVRELTKKVVAEFGIPVGIHAHNDSGLAVANSLAAVDGGALQVQGTLAGFGERCGNANLSTIVPNIRIKLGKECLSEESLAAITVSTRRVAEIANISFDEGMPYVGRRAFAHKGGMHIDAVMKDPVSFEHVEPPLVGNDRRFLASEVGGRSVILDKIRKIDPSLGKDSPSVALIVERLKEMERDGYQFEGADGSLELLMRKATGKYKPFFQLGHYRTIGEQPVADKAHCATALVKVEVEGVSEISAAEGDGPVNALDLALRKALERFYPNIASMRLVDFKVRVIDSGATASAVRVLIESADQSGAWTTVGVSTDIIEASWIALVDSIEYKLIKDIERRWKAYV